MSRPSRDILERPCSLRFAHGVRLNPQGKAYLKDIQRIFADLNHATERHRHRRKTPLLKLVAIEVVAEKWLMPQLAHFKTLHPDIVIEFEVDHGEVDPDRRDFDVWIAFADEVPDTVLSEKLEQGTLVTLFDSPVTAPAPYLLVTAVASREKPQVVAFRDWVFRQASSKTLDFRTGPIAPVTGHV